MALVIEKSYKLKDAAKNLPIHVSTLQYWIKQHDHNHLVRTMGLVLRASISGY